MAGGPSIHPIGLEKPRIDGGVDGGRPAEFSTLKKAFSASFSPASQTVPTPGQSSSKDRPNGDSLFPNSNLSIPPRFIHIPKMPNAAELAFAALQYLPTPLLILSNLKLVLLANEAVGRLLGLDTLQESRGTTADGDEERIPVAEMLRGQSLSQIGIDMVQDGQQIWVSWEV